MSMVGGVEQVTSALSKALAADFEVHVLSLLNNGPSPYGEDGRITYAHITTEEKRLRQMQKELKKPVAKYLKENRIDVAIIQGTYAGFITAPARFLCKTKLVFCDHGALLNQWKDKSTTLARFVSSLLCHKTVTLTRRSLEDYRRRFLIPKRKIETIYNWIDTDAPRSAAYDSDSRRILSAGRFGSEKGFDLLIKAFAKVVGKHPDWSLDLFGDGEMMDTVKSLIEEYHLSDNVRLMGMRTDLAERYGDYALYALPSYREGMPLVLLEAKANLLPIVSFDILTGPREIVRDGVDGFLVEPYDLDAFADRICRLIEDKELRQKMSRASQGNLEEFSKSTILKKWQDLIRKLSGKGVY